jgi:RNase H-fold protein (predicted Holliday junction resolvase)
MPEEPDNLILSLLREIRAVQDQQSAKLTEHDLRFDELKKQIEEWETTATGIGFAAHANVRTQAIEREIAELKNRIKRLEDAR